MVLAVVQTICVTLACNNGLGRHRSTLSESSYDTFGKYLYSSDILLIATLAFAKASVTLLIVAINRQRTVLLACYGILAVVALWAVTATIALAFQCNLPHPWDSDLERCLNQQALLVFIGTVNILTDIAVVLLSFFLMRSVQVSAPKRWRIVGLFATQIIVPIMTILSLTKWKPYLSSVPPDKPWHAVAPTIWAQIMLYLSIITACIPSLKHFLQDLQSGAMAINIIESVEMSVSKKVSASPEGGYTTGLDTGCMSSAAGKPDVKSQTRNEIQTASHGKDNIDDRKYGYEPGDARSLSPGHNINAHKFSTQRSTVERGESVKGLTGGVIYRTVDFKVEYEGRSSEGSGDQPSPPHNASGLAS